MARVFQLSECYLRGSLMAETAKHLSSAQKEHVASITAQLEQDPDLVRHCGRIVFQLEHTIACDYSDRVAGTQDLRIALWRGVVYLFYHCDYTYRCAHCDAIEYQSQRGQAVKFTRRLESCPCCGFYEIQDPGASGLDAGTLIHKDEFLALITRLSTSGIPQVQMPSHRSCIMPVPGKKKIENPQAVIDDSVQRKKFFKQFIWNWFKQILKENAIRTHGPERTIIVGAIEEAVIKSIISYLNSRQIQYNYVPADNPHGGKYVMSFSSENLSPTERWVLYDIYREGLVHGAMISVGAYEWSFRDGSGSQMNYAPTTSGRFEIKDMGIRSPVISVLTTQESRVAVVGSDNEDMPNPVDQVEHTMYSDTEELERRELYDLILSELTNGNSRKIFSIFIGRELYEQFITQFPESVRQPRQNQIAQFLGCTAKEVKRCMVEIRLRCIAHGIGPKQR